MGTVKCKISNKAYVAGNNYKYEPHTSGIFNMLQVFAETGDEDDDELFYPDEMEKYFFWEKDKDMTGEKPKFKPPPKTYSSPPPPPKVEIKEDYPGPHGKRYKMVLEQIRSREEQVRLYPTDPNVGIWKTEIESFKGTASKLKKKLDGKG